MRTLAIDGPLQVQAIAGTYVVLLGIDLERAAADGVLGFGVERIDHTEGEHRWLTNNLRFDAVINSEEEVAEGAKLVKVSEQWGTDYNPLQTFLWGDYTAKPDHTYTYYVHALTGMPGTKLTPVHTVMVQVRTEQPKDQGVWFNRGVISSQAYTRRFDNKHPKDVPNNEAWIWLSRGLEEALLAFIGRAVSEDWELHGTFYEFTLPRALEAFGLAARVGAKVELIVHKDKENEEAVTAAAIDPLVVTWRENTDIPHNKFLVASLKGQPIAVWTGSTNVTDNGVFGHSNVGHYQVDRTIAQAYLDYWHQVKGDPEKGELKKWVNVHNPLPIEPETWPVGTSVVFSPHSKIDALDRYVAKFNGAEVLACATFPFNLYKGFHEALPGDHSALRYLLFESKTEAGRAAEKVTDPKTVVVAGGLLPDGALKDWLGEMKNPLAKKIYFIHTKYLLIDPLGEDPLVITGSANFSAGSTTENDENMLIIRGDKAVADIYLTEFMRLFSHYKFRHFLKLPDAVETPGALTEEDAAVSLETTSAWMDKYYDEPERARQREVLSGHV